MFKVENLITGEVLETQAHLTAGHYIIDFVVDTPDVRENGTLIDDLFNVYVDDEKVTVAQFLFREK